MTNKNMKIDKTIYDSNVKNKISEKISAEDYLIPDFIKDIISKFQALDFNAVTDISTLTFFGKPATWTVSRAGNWSLK